MAYALLAALAVLATPQSPPSLGSPNLITEGRLRAHLTFVAHDLLEGRDTPSRGLEIACLYVATQCDLWGLKPAGDNGTFFQEIPLRGSAGASGRKAYNVVAKIEGTDPTLKAEYIAFGAHIDHIGIGQPDEKGDTIYNGADDDGSGTCALLEIAHAMAEGARPKRSLLFVWHAGEEKGLWGAEHFTNNPTVPLEKIVAQLNIDMIGRSATPGVKYDPESPMTGPDAIHVIGSRRISGELGDIVDEVNARLHKLTLDRFFDRPNDPRSLYFRSDHFMYARKGIPIAFFFDGEHEDYHRPSDEVSKIDFRKLARVTRTVYAIGFVLATRPDRLKIDAKPPTR